ncbi:flagellar hook-associated protein FlgK [Bacillus sp. FJAT-49736]|uniref:flagellar hook-associated protein FlgK n=1 Tax=Bacillus sp. FJAT-49736 TaxID=2833582 RepID=UPI001BC8CA37|nr:flagellar hook-associated protein FlgK [Bacillus sp. FJAT-49736]MBS4174164.1 flagellar hook-associated protein FlgK [Bacillus sp. FJAT-49736]
MTSTFFGLETAKRGMTTQQNALFVTGQNISNANTPGYTRQRINFEATEPFPPASMNRPQIPGQMGTGVQAGSVQRVREAFLDQQYRGENNKLGYWSTRADSLSKMEDIMNEPSDTGLSAALGQFWQSLQDLSVNPENDGARSVVIQRGLAVTETFHYLSDSITSIQQNIGNQIGVSVKDINSILKQISEVNKQIASVEPHGYLPNDLYDERDRLVDQLSSYVNIKVETTKSGGTPSPLADGIYNIKMVGANGQEVALVSGSNYNSISIKGGTSSNNDGVLDQPPSDAIDAFVVSGTEFKISDFPQGKLKALSESYGYKDTDGSIKGIYPDMLDQLDKLAYTFATVFNEVHKQGYTLDSSVNGGKGGDFFDLSALNNGYKGAAKLIEMGNLANKDIAASTEKDNAGNGTNAINLSNVQGVELSKIFTLEGFDPSNPVTIDLPNLGLPLTSGSINTNYQSIIGKLGVDAQQANRLTTNSNTLTQSVDQNRQSVSSVSLDEEMINMIKFQQAYNASARNITILDEMLDKIINGLGTGGR